MLEGRDDMKRPAEVDLEAVYREHRQGLFTMALSITRSPHRAEDAVHEAFVKLYDRSGLIGDPAAYVYAAVRNAAIDQLRRGPKESAAGASIFRAADDGSAGPIADQRTGGGDGPSAGNPARKAAESERAAAIRRAVDEMDLVHREVIAMKVYSGLTFGQIAEAVGEPLSTVASRYRRGLAKLEAKLSKWK